MRPLSQQPARRTLQHQASIAFMQTVVPEALFMTGFSGQLAARWRRVYLTGARVTLGDRVAAATAGNCVESR